MIYSYSILNSFKPSPCNSLNNNILSVTLTHYMKPVCAFCWHTLIMIAYFVALLLFPNFVYTLICNTHQVSVNIHRCYTVHQIIICYISIQKLTGQLLNSLNIFNLTQNKPEFRWKINRNSFGKRVLDRLTLYVCWRLGQK